MKKKLVNREPIGNSKLNSFIRNKIKKANSDNGIMGNGKTTTQILQEFADFVKEVKSGIYN